MKKTVSFGLLLIGFGCMHGSAENKKETPERTVAWFVQDPEDPRVWRVVRVQESGESELSVRPGSHTNEDLTVATLVAMRAQEAAEQDQLKD